MKRPRKPFSAWPCSSARLRWPAPLTRPRSRSCRHSWPAAVPRASRRAPTATSGSPRTAAAGSDRVMPPTGTITEFSTGSGIATARRRRSRRAPTATSGSPRRRPTGSGASTPARHGVTEFAAGSQPGAGSPRARTATSGSPSTPATDRADHPGRRDHRVPRPAIGPAACPTGSPPAPTATSGSPSSTRQPDRADHAGRRRHRVPGRITAASQPARASRPGPTATSGSPSDAGNAIGRITPAGVVTEFPLRAQPRLGPVGIAAGPDGNLWFTEFGGNSGSNIGRITPAGVVTEFPQAQPSSRAARHHAGPGRRTSGSPSPSGIASGRSASTPRSPPAARARSARPAPLSPALSTRWARTRATWSSTAPAPITEPPPPRRWCAPAARRSQSRPLSAASSPARSTTTG